MKNKYLILGVAYAISLHGQRCNISDRDQGQLLLKIAEPRGSLPQELAGKTVSCLPVGDTVAIKHPSWTQLYILSRKRKFDRWTVTGRSYTGTVENLLSDYAQTQLTISPDLDELYGRGPFTTADQAAFDKVELQWMEITLLGAPDVERLRQMAVPPNVRVKIETDVKEKVNHWLDVNGFAGASSLQIRTGSPTWLSEWVPVTVDFRRKGKNRRLEFRLFVNVTESPYDGRLDPATPLPIIRALR